MLGQQSQNSQSLPTPRHCFSQNQRKGRGGQACIEAASSRRAQPGQQPPYSDSALSFYLTRSIYRAAPWAFLVTQLVKNPPAMQETWV